MKGLRKTRIGWINNPQIQTNWWRFDRNLQDYEKNIDKGNSTQFFSLSNNPHLRGHSLKLFKVHVKSTARQNWFSQRVIDLWNKLPQSVIDAPSVNSFKNRLDS